MNVELMNAVSKIVIDHCNATGIVLANEFKTRDDFTKFVVGITLTMLQKIGLDVDAAWNVIFGAGAFEQLASDLWSRLNG